MTTLDALADTIFNDPVLSEAADYKPAATGVNVPVRVLHWRPSDTIQGFGSSRLSVVTDRFRVRASEVATPVEGDRVIQGSDTFFVQGSPQLDAAGRIWTLDTYRQ